MFRSALWLTLPMLLGAQAPPPATEAPEAMKRLAPMVGTWSGEGWIRRGPGEPQRFKGQETVEAKVGGHVLAIEGRHLDGQDGRVVHNAFAVLSYDATAGTYRFRSHLANGMAGDYSGEWKDGAFIWSMEIPQRGRMRYTIRIEGDAWTEVGEMERGGAWVPFFGMKMRRTGA